MGGGGEPVERKLTAIYDAFDSRNYKLALKLSTSALQKHPDHATLRALRAVALDRTGKPSEALRATEELLATVPTDESVLSTLAYVLRPAGRLGDLTGAYERAVAKQPGNAELLTGLFGGYVREFAFVKQQQAALKLQKGFPSERHQWWVIDSIALQAHAASDASVIAESADADDYASASDSSSPSAAAAAAPAAAGALWADRLLQLAESMAARQVAQRGGGIQGVEALDLYLGVLFAQGKAAEALALLDGPLGETMRMAAERRQVRAALLASLGRRSEAAALFRAALEEQPDDWSSLLLYLDALLPSSCASGQAPPAGFWFVAKALGRRGGLLAENEGSEGVRDASDALSEAAAFIDTLPTKTAGNSSGNGDGSDDGSSSDGGGKGSKGKGRPAVLRGPALARVELASRRLALGLGGEQELAEAVLVCYDRIGHLTSCAMDLRLYVALLTGPPAAWLASQLSSRLSTLAAAAEDEAAAAAATDGRASAEALAVLRRRVCAYQIRSELQPQAAAAGCAAGEGSEGRACDLLEVFADALPLSRGLDERERGPADELLALAAAELVSSARRGAAGGNSSSSGRGDGTTAAARLVPLLRAAVVLEAGACGRPYGAECRLGLTGLYGLLGCASTAGAHFAKTDAKHIQMDTLASHHLLPPALALGADKISGPLLSSTLALFDDHMRDAGDTLMAAYKQDTHTKVLEFVMFKERLERAHSYAVAKAEKAISKLRRQLAGGGTPAGGGSSSSGSSAGSGSAAAAGGAAPAGAAAAAAAAAGPGGAAAAAAAAVPLEALQGPAWRAMRFNADLQTRPPWLPPAPCAVHLAVMLWWETDSNTTSGGSVWWRRVAAAEATVPEAAALRTGLRSGARARWLLPHLLAAALSADAPRAPTGGAAAGGAAARASAAAAAAANTAAAAAVAVAPGPLAAAEGVAQLAALLPQYAAALSVSPASPAGIASALTAAFGTSGSTNGSGSSRSSSSGGELSASRQLQLLELALFNLGESAVQLVAALQHQQQVSQQQADEQADGAAASSESIGQAADAVAARAALLSAALSALQRRAAAVLAPGASLHGLFAGDALSLASLLSEETLLWVVSCLEAWSRAVRACRRKSSKRGASAPPTAAATATPALSAPPVAAAFEALAAAGTSAAGLLGTLASAAGAAAAAAGGQEAELLRLLDPSCGDPMRKLAGWEPRLSVQHVVKAVIGEQRALLTRAAAAAAALQQRLSVVAW